MRKKLRRGYVHPERVDPFVYRKAYQHILQKEIERLEREPKAIGLSDPATLITEEITCTFVQIREWGTMPDCVRFEKRLYWCQDKVVYWNQGLAAARWQEIAFPGGRIMTLPIYAVYVGGGKWQRIETEGAG